jgi:serine/threonine-protein kinase
MELQFGQIYGGKYRVLGLIGQGGMGAVYEGEDITQHRRVAIKTLRAELAGHTQTLQRFEREAEAASRVGSEHIVEMIELGALPDGTRFMVMEFLEGMTLRARLKERGRLPAEEAARIIVDLLEGLAAAHAAGIVHRDLKPANVFLLRSHKGQADFVKLLDFGVSKVNEDDAAKLRLTGTGIVLGTPHYMSPEQAKGSRDVDPRADVYAAGVILFECLSGQVPFQARSFNELIFRIVMQPAPTVDTFAPDVDPELCAIVARAMARDLPARYQSAREFQRVLLDWKTRLAGGARSSPRTGAMPLPPPPPPRPTSASDADLADHGTVIMDRRAAAMPLPPPNPPPPVSLPLPTPPPGSAAAPALPPPGMPAAAMSMTSAPRASMGSAPAVPPPPASNRLPSVADLAPVLAPPPAATTEPRKLAPLVGAAAFAVVFVLGGLVLLVVRWTQGPAGDPAAAESAPAAAASAPAAPPPAPLATAESPIVPASATADTKTVDAPAASASAKTRTPTKATSGGRRAGKGRSISNDL